MTVDYSEISKRYDEYRSYNDDVIKAIAETASISHEMTVLDLGGGTGNIALELKKLTRAHLICLDISPGMLRKAKEKSITVLCADANNNLPFKSNSFDVIIGAYVIHHINKVGVFIRECSRVLKNGRLLLLTSSHDQIENFHPVAKNFFPSCVEIEKKRFPAIDYIIYLMKIAGFNDIHYHDILIEKNEINEEYLQRVKNKYVSTFYLVPADEFKKGISKIECLIRSGQNMNLPEWRGTIIFGYRAIG
ncbi:MAG: hypothetical protein A2W19_06235 [Spirochaetes bacterium RBG_16_49_21]|nr:MAG: hypothetical protein A2W19_06235 [Spirochaetes bacterium RBG_16_49_21]